MADFLAYMLTTEETGEEGCETADCTRVALYLGTFKPGKACTCFGFAFKYCQFHRDRIMNPDIPPGWNGLYIAPESIGCDGYHTLLSMVPLRSL